MTIERLQLLVNNDLDGLERARVEATACLERFAADPDLLHAVLLALEEVVTNVIKYGHDHGGRHPIAIVLETSAGGVRLELSDDGRPFDPLRQPEPDLDAPIEERAVGGLGIVLLRELTETMTYERQGERNVLTLEFKRNRAQGG